MGYSEPTPAYDSSTNGTHGKAAALKRDRPAAGAVADKDTAGLDDLPRGEETPSKRQAAASISSSSLTALANSKWAPSNTKKKRSL
jgi:hypothetical protein